jgi:hypothetical protein
MKYEQATWRIRVSARSYIEVSIKGCDSDRESADSLDVLHAARVLADVARAIGRIAQRWSPVIEKQL